MRHQWYADGRDLIKWGALLLLAKKQKVSHIIQVAFLRPDATRPKLQYGREIIGIPNNVWSHFRQLDDIKRLERSSGITIDLISNPFEKQNRSNYVEDVARQCRASRNGAAIIFLDPDTGIAERDTKPEHVALEEVIRIWDALLPGDWLVLYQHSFRKEGWHEIKQKEFAKATGRTPDKIKAIRAIKGTGATDVVFLCVKKK